MKREPTTPPEREGIGCWSMMSKSGERARTHVFPPHHRCHNSPCVFAAIGFASSDIIVAWAKDEPPTPDSSSDHAESPSYDRRNADSASFNTDTGPPSRWWTFALPRANSGTDDAGTSQSQAHPGSVRHRSMTWLTSAPVLKDAAAFARKDQQRLDDEKNGLNLRVATQFPDTFTLEQHTTLDPQRSRSEIPPRESLHALQDHADESEVRNLDDDLNEWPIRRKRFRNFILVNPYAPLVCPSLMYLSCTCKSNSLSYFDLSI
jgi:hypothetical protein